MSTLYKRKLWDKKTRTKGFNDEDLSCTHGAEVALSGPSPPALSTSGITNTNPTVPTNTNYHSASKIQTITKKYKLNSYNSHISHLICILENRGNQPTVDSHSNGNVYATIIVKALSVFAAGIYNWVLSKCQSNSLGKQGSHGHTLWFHLSIMPVNLTQVLEMQMPIKPN